MFLTRDGELPTECRKVQCRHFLIEHFGKRKNIVGEPRDFNLDNNIIRTFLGKDSAHHTECRKVQSPQSPSGQGGNHAIERREGFVPSVRRYAFATRPGYQVADDASPP